uniref:Uncharacterized protein n=1 Tax=Clytia hemisphaerica TaxID=252671 RepID=A0A7M6DPN3_9CNID
YQTHIHIFHIQWANTRDRKNIIKEFTILTMSNKNTVYCTFLLLVFMSAQLSKGVPIESPTSNNIETSSPSNSDSTSNNIETVDASTGSTAEKETVKTTGAPIVMRDCIQQSLCTDADKAVKKCISCKNGGSDGYEFQEFWGLCFCYEKAPAIPQP